MTAAHFYAITPQKKEQAMRDRESADAECVIKDIIEHIDTGEPVRINGSRKKVFVVSEKEYKGLMKAKNNAEYLARLNESLWQLKNGIGMIKSLDELRPSER
jgi:antitoxin YefM